MTLKLNKQARLGVAVAAVIGGATIASDVTFARPNAAGAGFAPTNTGQVAVIPYYTVRNGWVTTANVTNVTDSALLVKVRVRESQNSRDVLDFNVMMSPRDVWNGYIAVDAGTDVAPHFFTPDNSCTTPEFRDRHHDGAPRQDLLREAYTGPFSDGGDTSNERMHEGYIEFIVIGECRPGDRCMEGGGIGWLTKHVDGEPRDCRTAREMSLPRASRADFPQPGQTFNPDQRHGNPAYRDPNDYTDRTTRRTHVGYGPVHSYAPLKANVSYLKTDAGLGAGAEALHLDQIVGANRARNDDPMRDPAFVGVNLVTAQDQPYFLEPTLATVPRGLWDARAIDVLERRFTWNNVYNEWATNPGDTGAYVDWIVNFPTKAFHVDQFCNMWQANNNAWRNDGDGVMACDEAGDGIRFMIGSNAAIGQPGTPGYRTNAAVLQSAGLTLPLGNFSTRWSESADGTFGAPVNAVARVYDREEATSGPIFSPGPTFRLEYETNVIRFVEDISLSPLASPTSNFINPQDALAPDVEDARTGWFDLGFGTGGIPAYGFAIKTRAGLGVGGNYGQMMNHGYNFGELNNPDR